ncbi:MAG: RCC1 domain-containing protein, partial [Terrimicrobiaceae bacterium]
MAFVSCQQGDLKEVFITEFDIIDRYVGSQLWLWGLGSYGRLGNNSTTSRSSPVQTVSTGTDWKQVDAAIAHAAAIKTDGTLWLWGYASCGRLGNNSTVQRSSPVQAVSTGTNWSQVKVGRFNSGATKTDGTLWIWGDGTNGKLGNNSTTNRSSPVQTIACGTNWANLDLAELHSAAVKTDGTLWLWGRNIQGQLGTNSTIDQSSPVQTLSTGINWKQVSLGFNHSAAIKCDGTLWMWGGATCGALGTNSTTDQSSPVQTISTGTNWKQVSLGFYQSASVKTDGTLWLWGNASTGQLGNNTTIDQSSPVQTVSTGTNWKQVGVSSIHSAAIKTDGTLWLWGENRDGRLGNNSTINQSSPVQTLV